MRRAQAQATVELTPEAARRLWLDVGRWPAFVEGFAHTVEVSPDWPSEGAKLVWQSVPSGRGRVTERVAEGAAERFVTDVYEDSLVGKQTISFAEVAEGTRIELRLDYELSRYGPLRALADAVFIRRALRDALRRTLRRFAVEAEEDARIGG
ncbi:MAG: SRPBCC family protein [Thermoleophilaceae bacterium]